MSSDSEGCRVRSGFLGATGMPVVALWRCESCSDTIEFGENAGRLELCHSESSRLGARGWSGEL